MEVVKKLSPGSAAVLGILFGAAIMYGYLALQSMANIVVHEIRYTETGGFTPDELFIVKGDTVRFINDSDIDFWPASNLHPEHNLYPAFDPKASVPPGSVWEFTFDRAGPWHFHDHLKAHHLGIIYVFEDNVSSVEDLCSGSEDQQYCITNYFYHIVGKYGPAVAMDQVKAMHADNKLQFKCHKMAHDIGHVTYALYKTGFELSESLIICSAGFFHGIMEGYISDHEDIADARRWCEEMTLFYEGIYKEFMSRCAHGVGHGLGETMLVDFDNHWQQFKDLTVAAARTCEIFDDVELYREVCESGLYAVVIEWILTTQSQDYYFSIEEPFAFCKDLETETLIRACLWEFSQRMYTHYPDDDRFSTLFKDLADHLERSGLLEQYGVVSAHAIGLQLTKKYFHDDTDERIIHACRVENALVQEGCFNGVVEGFIISGIWKEEMERARKFCSHELFSDEEEQWCLATAERYIAVLR